ncbi:MAG: glutamate-5-semialdehyde dehydrogenase [Alphaproteobacteria bacterium]|jgi:glutamate-5-semialdehyde dehydrogenase|tara:strand:+ start:5332 stop:6609 length:1278 start_codon:yes stop_codon:yes gene_type:complete
MIMDNTNDIKILMESIGKKASLASKILSNTTDKEKNIALRNISSNIRQDINYILSENKKDLQKAAQNNKATSIIDRLTLNSEKIESIALSIDSISKLTDPVGKILSEWEQPNGLCIKRVTIPIGVIGIIYESRPNVTADAAALCLKSGNASILRGGSDSFYSCQAIYNSIRKGLSQSNLSEDSVQFVPTTDRNAVGYMLSGLNENIDVIVPRGGKSLVSRVREEARVPVFGHLEGICHVYIHKSADLKKAIAITLNSKMRRPSICGAAETLLIDKSIANKYLPQIIEALVNEGCEIRGDQDVQAIDNRVTDVSDLDWDTEYLDAIISVRIVNDENQAIDHIMLHGTGHTEAIVTEDKSVSAYFTERVDSSIVLINASTQFADGGEFGFGAEIGISTGRLHARGPIGVDQLTTFKYIVTGNGQLRP